MTVDEMLAVKESGERPYFDPPVPVGVFDTTGYMLGMGVLAEITDAGYVVYCYVHGGWSWYIANPQWLTPDVDGWDHFESPWNTPNTWGAGHRPDTSSPEPGD